MFNFIRKMMMKKIEKNYVDTLPMVKEMLYSKLIPRFNKEFDLAISKTLATKVISYLTGEDISDIITGIEESLRERILRINPKLETIALQLVDSDREIRELIVYTLMMKVVVSCKKIGTSYLNSAEKKRIEEILIRYGSKFPEEATLDRYISLVLKYHKKHFKGKSR